MHKAQNYFSLNAKYEASETVVDRRPQHCRLSCGKQLRHRGANARLQLFKNGIFRKLFKTPISERWGKQICLNE
jgi:hypothetical protein